MSSKGLDKSAATVRAKSRVGCRKVYLSPTNSNVQLSKAQAAELARNLLMLALDDEVQGYITLAAFNKEKPDLTVLGRKKASSSKAIL